mgnify:CR=1 FL=1
MSLFLGCACCFCTFFVPIKKLSDEISDIKDGFGKEQLDVDDYAETAYNKAGILMS